MGRHGVGELVRRQGWFEKWILSGWQVLPRCRAWNHWYIVCMSWPGRRLPTSETFLQWPSNVVKTTRKQRCRLCLLDKMFRK